MHSAVQYTMQNNAEQPNANNYCTAVAYHESVLLLQGWWGGPCTALQMWPILAGRKSGVKVVNCVHDSQGDQIGHLHPAAHHSHSTFSWGTLQQGTAHEMRVISIQCSSITNIHTQLYTMFKVTAIWIVQNLFTVSVSSTRSSYLIHSDIKYVIHLCKYIIYIQYITL